MARADITAACRSRLNKTMAAVRPADLYRQIRDLTAQLELLALSKAAAPAKPQVNWAFNHPAQPEVLVEATMQPWRRI
jgi:hypothetical protein